MMEHAVDNKRQSEQGSEREEDSIPYLFGMSLLASLLRGLERRCFIQQPLAHLGHQLVALDHFCKVVGRSAERHAGFF